MEKKYRLFVICIFVFAIFIIWFLLSQGKKGDTVMKNTQSTTGEQNYIDMVPSTSLSKMEEGISTIRFDEDYGFQKFIEAGGASSDKEVVNYLMDSVLSDISGLQFLKGIFGCSTIQTRNEQKEVLFGRNFDWENSEAFIIESTPKDAYASISTVNLDFIQSGTSIPISKLPDNVLASIAMYAPLDGMNEKGLAISVNMIQDSAIIRQTGKSQNLTTTTAIRLILNQAANVDEALAILRSYNLHSSMNMMIHFAIADATGRSVVVEYVNQQMNVIETPVVTNFYLSEGEKQGIGSEQSHERYDILMDLLKTHETMDMNQVRDALDRVSKDNFNGEFESTEWSIVYNLDKREIHYYHRENYTQRYIFRLNN